MTRLTRLIPIIALLLATLHTACASPRPNIVLIVTDNQSEQLFGVYGNPDVRTPNIDALAGQGMRFTRAYAVSGVCSPTRATLLTGLIPSQHGVHNGLPAVFEVEGWSAVSEFRSLPQTLADAGYDTALIGKYHLGVPQEPQLGFQYWVTFPTGHTSSFIESEIIDNGETYPLEGEHLTDFWSRRAEEYIATRSADRPFFLYLAYNGPYNLPPLVTRPPANRHADYYADNVPEFPQEPVHPYLRNVAIEESSVEDVLRVQADYRAWGVTDPEETGEAGASPELSYGWQTIEALNNRTAMINLASETAMIDDGVGRVLDALEEHGLVENTIVVFTSDQSSAFGQHGLWGNSSWARPHPVYREHMQVPLIVRMPGVIPAGTVNEGIVNQYDIMPTLLELAGLADRQIANAPGRSLAAALRRNVDTGNDAAFFEYITARAIVTREWKYIKRLFGEPSELYNLAEDPEENENLVNDPGLRDVVGTLDARLSEFFLAHADPRYDPWRGGTGKAVLMYSDRNEKFEAEFPDWQPPFVESVEPFSDR